MKNKNVFRLWSAWNIEKIEKYLEDMAKNGWHLKEVSHSLLVFHFVEGEPRKTSFSVDYRSKEDKEYFAILEDAGWQCLGKGAGWFIWRQEYTNNKPKIYTDKQSLIDRSKRIISILLFALLMQFPLFVINLDKTFLNGGLFQANSGRNLVFWIHSFLILVLLGGLAAVIVSMQKFKKELE